MPPEDQVRISRLVEAAEKAIGYTAGRRRTDLEQDELLRLHPAVPWAAAARMRDGLVHHYFDIGLDVLWSTIQEDPPRVLEALRST